MAFKSTRNVVYSCKYPVVRCPKYRHRVQVNDVNERLKAILREVTNETRSAIIEIDGMPDHVSVLVERHDL
jgi:putative transposase